MPRFAPVFVALLVAAGETRQGPPVKSLVSCEGNGDEIGAMGLARGARNAEPERRFHERQLTPAARALATCSRRM